MKDYQNNSINNMGLVFQTLIKSIIHQSLFPKAEIASCTS